MATFQLSQGLNSVNNPTLDNIFEYGYINVSDSSYVKFDTYGYTDGSTNPVTPQNVILGWYKSDNAEDFVAIAYQHLGLPNEAIHFQITPQPFPVGGIYIHPSVNKKPVVRIHSPFNSTFSLTGTIQRATDGCGSNIGYTVIKNQTTSLIARTVLNTNTTTPTSVTLSSVSLTLGDYVDVMIDAGDDGNDQCDDTAIDFTVTFTPNVIQTPILRNAVTCNSTSLIYDILLQQSGVASLYKVGTVSPISTQNLTVNGIDGIVTFSGLNLTTGGEYYVIVTNSGQTDSAQSIHTTITPCYTGSVNDLSIATTKNTPVNIVLTTVACNIGTTTYTILTQPSHGTLSNLSGASATYTPASNYVGTDSYVIEQRCDGAVIDIATVSLTINNFIANAVNDSFSTLVNTILNGNVTTNDTVCNVGTTTFALHTNSAHGNVTLNSNGIFFYQPTTDYVGNDSFEYDLLCNGNIIDTATVSLTVNSITTYCNEEFQIQAVKNDCTVGTPTMITYVVEAGIVCGKTSVEKANWEAYLISLPLAQISANNIAICIDCTPLQESEIPTFITSCVDITNPFLHGNAIPSSTLTLYNQSLVVLGTFTTPLTGIFNINIMPYYNDNEAFLLIAKDGIKRDSDFSRFVIKCENVYKKKSKKYKHCC